MTALSGKAALVTGASRNLGATIAQVLAERGARVAVNYRTDAAAAAAVVDALPGDGHVALQADVSRAGEAERLVAAARERLGSVDVLVNNAGPFAMTPFTEMEEEEWDRVWDANAKATYLVTRLVAPGMRAAGWGRVVNVSATSYAVRNHSIYGLAKDAIRFLTEELAVELGPQATVNAVAPGQIVESADDIAEFDPTFVERAVAATPAGRLVRRREVAELVAVLCTPAFDMVTGVTIPVDGGFRLPRF